MEFSGKDSPHYLIFKDNESPAGEKKAITSEEMFIVAILAIAGGLFAIFKIMKHEEKYGVA